MKRQRKNSVRRNTTQSRGAVVRMTSASETGILGFRNALRDRNDNVSCWRDLAAGSCRPRRIGGSRNVRPEFTSQFGPSRRQTGRHSAELKAVRNQLRRDARSAFELALSFVEKKFRSK